MRIRTIIESEGDLEQKSLQPLDNPSAKGCHLEDGDGKGKAPLSAGRMWLY